MKGQKFEISSYILGKANGLFECYNVSADGMVHLAKVSNAGRKLAVSAKNMLNLSGDMFRAGVEAGRIVEA